jgi:hypothetical protein
MSVRNYGLLNLGRDKKPGSTQRIDRAALVKLRDALGGPDAKNAAAFLVEINEGDDNNELALALDVFKGWRCFGEHTHEPIFTTQDIGHHALATVEWVPDTAVQHWSPQRSVLRVELHDHEVLVATHPAAGPHTAAPRPEDAQGPLEVSWDNTQAKHLQVKRRMHAAGRPVTEMCDLNHYSLPGLPGETTVLHHRTDYGRAWPAKGYQARFRAGKEIRVGIDSHGIQIMHGTYHQEKP